MNVLVGCEESQEVCKAFRARGHEAFSNDIENCSGGHPEWHLKMDIFEALELKRWDLLIAFPPCTYLCFAGIRWNVNNPERQAKTHHAVNFVRSIMDCGVEKICIENPVGVISKNIRKFDQMIHPWQFGHGEEKKTCLWLKNLPLLTPTNVVEGRVQKMFNMAPSPDRAKLRSKTYPGIAAAMAEQWG
jgi:site-specific DNA-cytosine methylase